MTGSDPKPKENGDPPAKRGIDEDTKRAMALGRERSRAVDAYLKALEIHKFHNRGVPKPDPQVIKAEMARLSSEITLATGVAKLLLIQERTDLDNQLKMQSGADEFKRLEEKFVTIAKQFSTDRKISYDSWRQIGVPVRTLNRAGLYPPRESQGPSESLDTESLDT